MNQFKAQRKNIDSKLLLIFILKCIHSFITLRLRIFCGILEMFEGKG